MFFPSRMKSFQWDSSVVNLANVAKQCRTTSSIWLVAALKIATININHPKILANLNQTVSNKLKLCLQRGAFRTAEMNLN